MNLVVIPMMFAAGWLSPWWVLVLFGIAAGFYSKKPLEAAGLGFFLGAFVWGAIIITLEFQTGGIVAQRIGGLFGINNRYLFVAIVIIFAGLISLVASLLGLWARRLILVSNRD